MMFPNQIEDAMRNVTATHVMVFRPSYDMTEALNDFLRDNPSFYGDDYDDDFTDEYESIVEESCDYLNEYDAIETETPRSPEEFPSAITSAETLHFQQEVYSFSCVQTLVAMRIESQRATCEMDSGSAYFGNKGFRLRALLRRLMNIRMPPRTRFRYKLEFSLDLSFSFVFYKKKSLKFKLLNIFDEGLFRQVGYSDFMSRARMLERFRIKKIMLSYNTETQQIVSHGYENVRHVRWRGIGDEIILANRLGPGSFCKDVGYYDSYDLLLILTPYKRFSITVRYFFESSDDCWRPDPWLLSQKYEPFLITRYK